MRIIKILFWVALLGLLVFVPVHFWLTDRNGVMRAAFPLQSVLAKAGVTCSTEAPSWLEGISLSGVDALKALSTQVVFVDASGRLHHCETGWKGIMPISERVSRNSRFRYGSLTKPLTAAAILAKIRQGEFALNSTLGELIPAQSQWEEAKDSRISQISVEQLLGHRSGLGFVDRQHNVFTESGKPWCPYAILELARVALPKKETGEIRYSNLGYCVLGALLPKKGEGYRGYMEHWLQLSERGIGFAGAERADDEVRPDFRYNQFYNRYNQGSFDFYAISSTAGMTGSATAYAKLMRAILDMELEGFLVDSSDSLACNARFVRQCYGLAFYLYQSKNGEFANVKGGFMPGYSGLVAINDRGEVFVWLGNSDMENAASGIAISAFLDQLMETAF